MTTVYFARHGKVKVPNNQIYGFKAELNEDGKRQMRTLGDGFETQGIKFSAILTSSLRRASDSANIIHHCLRNKPKVVVHEGLNAMKIPGWVGMSFNDLDAEGDDFHGDPKKESDSEILQRCGETRKELDRRIQKTFNRILKEYEGQTILIISHSDELKYLMNGLENPDTPPRKGVFEAEQGQALKVVFEGSKIFKKQLFDPEERFVSREIGH
jgi:broad specificity phosphatase PhoE